MKKSVESCTHTLAIGVVLVCGVTILTRPASATTFSARETHRALTTGQGDGTTGALVPTGWFRRAGDPSFVYKAGGVTIAGVWSNGAGAAVVRGGTSEDAPVIGRIVPYWENSALRLTIEPEGSTAITTDVFGRSGSSHAPTLARDISALADLEGTYRANLPALAAAAAGAIAGEVDVIHGDLTDVAPLHR